MSKINVYGLIRPERKRMSTTIETSQGPQKITFQRLTVVDTTKAFELAESLIEKFVTGNEEDGTAPLPFFPMEGGDTEVTETLCRTAAQYAVSQQEDTDQFTAEEWLAIGNGVDTDTWAQIRKLFQDVNRGKSAGNASGAVTDTSSELPTG